jgi:hypothetical protein
MDTTELLVTGYDGPAIVFAATLTADEVKVIRPGTNAEGETVVGEAWQEATGAFCDGSGPHARYLECSPRRDIEPTRWGAGTGPAPRVGLSPCRCWWSGP